MSIYFNEQSLRNKMSSSHSSLRTKLQILVQSGVHQKKKPNQRDCGSAVMLTMYYPCFQLKIR